MELNELASWASIASLVISIVSMLLIRSVRAAVVASRRRNRMRTIISEVQAIPGDAIPLSDASRGKLVTLDNNLPSGYLLFWTAKSRTIRRLRKSLKEGDLSLVNEGIEDYKSHCEEDL